MPHFNSFDALCEKSKHPYRNLPKPIDIQFKQTQLNFLTTRYRSSFNDRTVNLTVLVNYNHYNFVSEKCAYCYLKDYKLTFRNFKPVSIYVV